MTADSAPRTRIDTRSLRSEATTKSRPYPRSVSDVPEVNIALWRADAVVLYDWLMTVDLNTVPINHPAEKQALMDLLTRLETETNVEGVTQDEIDAARACVAKDMGW